MGNLRGKTLFLGGLFTAFLGVVSPTSATVPGDAVVAVVDKQTITIRDLDFWAVTLRLQSARAEGLSEGELRRRVLTEAVDDHLLSGWAELQLGEVPIEAVDARLRAAWERYERLAGGPSRLDDVLEDAGIEREAFRLWVREQSQKSFLVREALGVYANLGGDSAADVELAQAERLRVAHIFVAPAGNSERAHDLALERALRIRRDLEVGLPFAEAAELYSDDVATKEAGGELGWFTKEELAPELWNAAISSVRGKASDAVKSSAGYHVLFVLDFETPAQKRFLQKLRREEVRQLRRLRDESEVRLAPGYTLRPLPEVEAEEPSFWMQVEKGLPGAAEEQR